MKSAPFGAFFYKVFENLSAGKYVFIFVADKNEVPADKFYC